jgi:hypothetical protein
VAAGSGGARAQGPADAERAASIAGWIADLNDDRFHVREAATERLRHAGAEAIEPLRAAAQQGNLEVMVRAVGVLQSLAADEDRTLARRAKAALEELAADRITAASQYAAAALGALRVVEQKRAVEDLFALGGAFGSGSIPGGPTTPSHVELKKSWRGGDERLDVLRHLVQMDRLSIYGSHITDAAVPHLAVLKNLRRLELYGTRISDAGLERLRAALPATEIDIRRGGLLGVRGQPSDVVCRFTDVAPGTAAERAGLQPGDVVLQCEGQPVADFKALTAIIATKHGGDKLQLTILRGERRLQIEVTLGEWGEE